MVECDVGDVGFAATGHGDIQILAGGRSGYDDVGGIDGHALGAMRRDRVAQIHMLGDIRRWQCDGPAQLDAEALGDDGAVGEDVGDPPPVTVAEPAATQ